MINAETLIREALESKAAHAAILDTAVIQFHEDFRKACEKNLCRKYDTNWMGPPAIGPISELKQRVLRYKQGLLFQTVHQLTSSLDWNGIMEAAKNHYAVFMDLRQKLEKKHKIRDLLPLNAGCCSVCERCAYLDKEPCRSPDQSFSSVEAYGMNVIALQKAAGVPYYYGKNTVCFVGLILLADPQP
jgi:predicted metal-binding protein